MAGWSVAQVRRWRHGEQAAEQSAAHSLTLGGNARAAMAMAEPVARLLAGELGRDAAWVSAQERAFLTLAEQYTVS